MAYYKQGYREFMHGGSPYCDNKGSKGGISIMEGYRIEHACLSSEELEAILMGLGSLDSVSASEYYEQLMEELSCGENVNRYNFKIKKLFCTEISVYKREEI